MTTPRDPKTNPLETPMHNMGNFVGPVTVDGNIVNRDIEARIIAASGPPAVDDLTTFLRKRIAEDINIASDCTGPDWHADPGDGDNAEHIARHDPARVLAEARGKLTVLNEIDLAVHGQPRPYIDALLFVARQMGLAYASHPDYKDNWRP